ncbi:MAG TPA: Ldh family oxidoreductase [Xanthobacteraceae bacterium]|nr:Ldh family oxidoreductase [Xanthobacteraceae bacterium]
MTSKTELHVISSADLQRFASALFAAAGVAQAMAEEWARSLVWANLRGVDSHGVLRIPGYIERLKSKDINPAPAMQIEKRAGAIAVLEADRAPGAVAMAAAMAEAIARAREAYVGWCAARNITHAGAVGYFALQAANAGMAGIVMSASGPMMAYYGASVSGVSTNPLAIAFPAANRPPLLLDMSTSTVAMGKVMSARDAGQKIPLGWGLDADGRDTTDPKKLATLLPLGGPKGSGLSFMIECLCSLMIGNPIIAPALASGGKLDAPYLNGIAIAVDLAAFGDRERILGESDRLARLIAGLAPADGVERIYLPGERGDSILRERVRHGIPLPRGTWSRLLTCAKALEVPSP